MTTGDIDRQRIHVLLRLVFVLALLIHAILLGSFIYLQITVLWILNIFSCSLYSFNLYLLKRQKYSLSTQLAILEIVIHSVVASLALGWTSYFALYLIACVILVINAFTLKLRLKILEVTVTSAIFLALFVLTREGFRVFTLDPAVLEAIALFNMVTVVSTIVFMLVRNFMENELFSRKLEQMSEIDMLTGTYNRRFFNKYLDIEIRRNASQIRYGLKGDLDFGIAMLDLDNFKLINDRYGHLVGDDVLSDVAHIMSAALFERDILCRYGGEEFVILFTATSRDGAINAIEKIRRLVESHRFYPNKAGPGINITISIGFASFGEEPDISRLLECADKRLYQAKKAGKNRVVSN